MAGKFDGVIQGPGKPSSSQWRLTDGFAWIINMDILINDANKPTFNTDSLPHLPKQHRDIWTSRQSHLSSSKSKLPLCLHSPIFSLTRNLTAANITALSSQASFALLGFVVITLLTLLKQEPRSEENKEKKKKENSSSQSVETEKVSQKRVSKKEKTALGDGDSNWCHVSLTTQQRCNDGWWSDIW